MEESGGNTVDSEETTSRGHNEKTDLNQQMEAGRKEHQEFEKTLEWSKFSKEDTTRVELVEIRQRTVTGFTLQEILPQGEYPKRVICKVWQPLQAQRSVCVAR
jgi:hypothetical protein